MLQDFDPEKHKGLPLLELITVESESQPGVFETVTRPAEVDFETASLTPWYYVVEVEDES